MSGNAEKVSMMMIPGPKTKEGENSMLDYMKIQHCDNFFTIAKACEYLGLTKDELRSLCGRYGVELFKRDGQWGFPGEDFRRFNNTLYYEQCRDGSDDSRIFTDVSSDYVKQTNLGRTNTMLSYIRNIKNLESTYTFENACTLLGVTPDELENICDENDIPTFQNHEGTRIITCYEYLTLNNRIYRKQCDASGKSDLA